MSSSRHPDLPSPRETGLLDRTAGSLLGHQAFDRLTKGGEGLGSFDREPLNGVIGLCFAEEKTRRAARRPPHHSFPLNR